MHLPNLEARVRSLAKAKDIVGDSDVKPEITGYATLVLAQMLSRVPLGTLGIPEKIELPNDASSTKLIKSIRGQVALSTARDISTKFLEADQKLNHQLQKINKVERRLRTDNHECGLVNQTIGVIADLESVFGRIEVSASDLNTSIDKSIEVGFREVDIDREGEFLFAQRVLSALDSSTPLDCISTVCPGYTYTPEGVYDFKGITPDAGLLGTIHLKCFREVIQPVLESNQVPFNYHVIVADLSEGFDDQVIEKFTDGDVDKFLGNAKKNVREIQLLGRRLGINNLQVSNLGDFFQTSYDSYKVTREQMINEILALARESKTFGHIFDEYASTRVELYAKFLGVCPEEMTNDTIRRRSANGFAQYFHHFNSLRDNAKCGDYKSQDW